MQALPDLRIAELHVDLAVLVADILEDWIFVARLVLLRLGLALFGLRVDILLIATDMLLYLRDVLPGKIPLSG